MDNNTQITEWISDGHYGFETQGVTSVAELLEAAGRCLDQSCSSDIVGPIVFRADDGKYYEGHVEFVLDEIPMEAAITILAEKEDE